MKFFVYSLLFSLLFSLGAKLHIFANYFINQAYYAEVLCKNKAVKNSCCKGKCAVEKELVDLSSKEEDPNAGTQQQLIKFSKAEEALCRSLSLNFTSELLSIVNTPYPAFMVGGNQSDLLRPPLI